MIKHNENMKNSGYFDGIPNEVVLLTEQYTAIFHVAFYRRTSEQVVVVHMAMELQPNKILVFVVHCAMVLLSSIVCLYAYSILWKIGKKFKFRHFR